MKWSRGDKVKPAAFICKYPLTNKIGNWWIYLYAERKLLHRILLLQEYWILVFNYQNFLIKKQEVLNVFIIAIIWLF